MKWLKRQCKKEYFILSSGFSKYYMEVRTVFYAPFFRVFTNYEKK